MKLLGFSIKDYRRIKAFEMTLGENGLYKIKGPNGQGKTSVIKSLEFLLAGKRGSVREGAQKATVVGHIKDGSQEWTIERDLTPDNKMNLKVHGSQSGKRDKAPQAFLDALINELTFDPRPFMNKTATERVKMYTEIMGLDFSSENKRINSLCTLRLNVGRKIKDIGNPELPFELVSIEAPDMKSLYAEKEKLMQEHQKLLADVSAYNAEQAKRESKIDKYTTALENLIVQQGQTLSHVERLKKELDDAEALLLTFDGRIKMGEKLISECEKPQPFKPEPVMDLSAVTKKIHEAESISEKLSMRSEYEAKIKQKTELQKEYDEYDTEIVSLRRKKIEKAALVDSPVDGLELRIGDDTEELFYNGRPSDDWAESEVLRVSAELCAAKHPDLRCIFIDGGESYDKKSLESLHEWAVKNDIQAIITIVDDIPDSSSEEDNTFWIEDGEAHAI
jgi:DNA repair exonuclease SbcCD ATPase subunit